MHVEKKGMAHKHELVEVNAAKVKKLSSRTKAREQEQSGYILMLADLKTKQQQVNYNKWK